MRRLVARASKSVRKKLRKSRARLKYGFRTGDWGRRQRVCIGLCYLDNLNRRTMAAVLNMIQTCHHRVKILHQSGSLIDRSRNRIVRRFMETGYEWLLFIDSDMFFPDGHNLPKEMPLLDALLRHRKPIVSALCVKRIPPHNPVISDFPDKKDFSKSSRTIIDGYFTNEDLIKVDAVGAAALLIHRKVFEKLEQAGEVEMIRPNGNRSRWKEKPFDLLGPLGEDHAFCWRAMEAGFDIWIDTTIPMMHIGEKLYSIMDFEAYKEHRGLSRTKEEVAEQERKAGGDERVEDF